MNLDLLLNPWIISIIIIAFVIGNLASMKYLGQSNLGRKNPKKKSDLDKLLEIYKHKDQEDSKTANNKDKMHSSKNEDQ